MSLSTSSRRLLRAVSPLRSSARSLSSPSEATDSAKIPLSGVKRIFNSCNAVCFDVDSTVIQEEGVDVLASFAKCGDEVAALTASAMGGSMPFQDALKARLDIIKPSRDMIDACNAQHLPNLSPGIYDLIAKLHSKDKLVFLVSGGFLQMIEPIAAAVNIPSHRIFANNILFDENGQFLKHDEDQPTCRDGGKARVVRRLKDELGLTSIVMIGDGATDMQSKPPADAVIGYGGVVTRDVVKEGADWFVEDFQELINALE